MQAGVPDMILNRPYHTSSYVPEAAAGNKVMAFGDFSYYWIADRQGRSIRATSAHSLSPVSIKPEMKSSSSALSTRRYCFVPRLCEQPFREGVLGGSTA